MLETALGSIAFPTEQKTVDSLVYQFLMRENADGFSVFLNDPIRY